MSTRSPEARAQLRDLAANPASRYNSFPVSESGLDEWSIIEEATATEILKESAYLLPTESMLKYVEVLIRASKEIRDAPVAPSPVLSRELNLAYLQTDGSFAVSIHLAIADVVIENSRNMGKASMTWREDGRGDPFNAGPGVTYLTILIQRRVFNALFNSINRFLHEEQGLSWTDVDLDLDLSRYGGPSLFEMPDMFATVDDKYRVCVNFLLYESYASRIKEIASFFKRNPGNIWSDVVLASRLNKVYDQWTLGFTFANGEEVIALPDDIQSEDIGRNREASQEVIDAMRRLKV